MRILYESQSKQAELLVVRSQNSRFTSILHVKRPALSYRDCQILPGTDFQADSHAASSDCGGRGSLTARGSKKQLWGDSELTRPIGQPVQGDSNGLERLFLLALLLLVASLLR